MKTNYATYTSVHREGNNILFLGYNEEGAPIKEKIRFQPEIFLEKKGGPFKTLKGIECVRKEFDSIGDTYDYIKQCKDIYKIYGCSDYVRQFIGRNFRGELKSRTDLVQVWWFDIETKVGGNPVQVQPVDDQEEMLEEEDNEEESKGGFPNPDTAEEQITLITMYNRTKKQITTWGLYAIDDPTMNSKQTPEQIQEDMEWIRSKNVDYRMFSDETSMLKDFLLFVKTNRMDVLSGWNSEFFDIPYLYNRLVKLLGESLAKHLSPWKIADEHKKFVMNKERTTYEIAGLNHVDLLDLYKKFNPGSKESFSLGFISNYELGTTKVELPGEDFRDSYENYWSTFVRYNIVDVLLLEDIDQKKQIINLCLAIAYMAKCNYGDVVSAMRTWESLIYNYFLELDIVEEWDKPKSKKAPLVGAYVHVPIPGFYKWAVSIDATSLYPSIMMMLNLSNETKKRKVSFAVKSGPKEAINNFVDFPYFTHDSDDRTLHKVDTTVFDPETELCAANGCITDKTVDGFMRILIQRMFKERKDAKNKMLELKKIKGDPSEISALNMKQNALKVSLNSLYGCLSMQYFKYFDNDLAEAVTMTGQMLIQKTGMKVNEILNMILGTTGVEYAMYMDTDSVYITFDEFVKKFCAGKEEKEIVAYLENFVFKILQTKINDYLDELMANFGVPKNIVTFKLEGIANNSIWLAKKRYISNLLYNEGVWYDPPEMKIMGMEIVRSSTPKFIKEQLKKAVDICINGTEHELQDFVAKEKEIFMKKDVEDISFPRGCNGLGVYSDPDTIYKKRTPVAVRGALLHNHLIKEKGLSSKIQQIGDGERVRFVYLKLPNPIHENVISYVNKLPAEFNVARYVDKKTMFEKGFIKPLEGVLSAIKWNWEEKNLLDL